MIALHRTRPLSFLRADRLVSLIKKFQGPPVRKFIRFYARAPTKLDATTDRRARLDKVNARG